VTRCIGVREFTNEELVAEAQKARENAQHLKERESGAGKIDPHSFKNLGVNSSIEYV